MSAPSYPFPPNQHQHQHKNLQQEWNELQVAQQRLTLQQQRLKLDQELLKTEKRNWKRSNKIKTSVQYDDQSINSLNSLIFDEKDEVVHELRQQLDETKEAAQKESLSLQEQLLDAQQTLENLKLEHGTSHAKRLDEVEKWKTMCAKEQEEMVQKQKEWQEQQQARDASFQSKLDNCRELIWQLELEKNNLELELVKVRDTPNDSDYWQGEAEKLRTQLVDTSQQLEDFRLLVPRNKQLLEQATVQQEKLRTKYTVLEAKYDEQQTLVTELQTFKEVWTQKYEALEQAHQKLVEEMKDCKNDQSESVSVASSSSLPNTTLPSDDPREWIRAGRKHVVEREWTSKTGLHGLYTGWLDITGNPQGHGTLRIDDGSIYDGEWNRGLRDGT